MHAKRRLIIARTGLVDRRLLIRQGSGAAAADAAAELGSTLDGQDLLPGRRALGIEADELGLEAVGDLRTSVGPVVPELRLVPPIGDVESNMSALSALRAPPQLSPGH